MPVFEVEYQGKVYEVDAPDAATAAGAFGSQPTEEAPAKRGLQLPSLGSLGTAPVQTAAEAARTGRLAGAGASRLLTGPGQVVTGAAEGLGFPGASVESYTQTVKDIERKIVGGEEITPEEAQVIEGFGVAAGVAIPAGTAIRIAGAPVRFWWGVGQGALGGAAGGATQFNPDATTPGEALKGPLIGGVTGGLFGMPPAVVGAGRNLLFSGFRKEPTVEAAEQLRQISQSGIVRDLPLSNAQRTGRYEAEVQEARVAGSVAKQFYNDQLNALAARIRAAQRPGKDASELGLDMTNALSSTRAVMQSRASKEYDAGINRAMALASSDVANNFGVRADNVLRTVAEADIPPDAWQKMMGPANAKYAKQFMELADVLQKNNGALSMADMMRLHQAANRMRAGLDDLAKGKDVSAETYDAIRFGNRLADAVEADIDTMSAKLAEARKMPVPPGANADMGRGYEAAWAEFEKTRAGYRAFTEARDQLRATAVNQAFGMTPRDSAQAWDTLMRKEPQEFIKAVSILREHSPETLIDLKRYKIREVANNMFDFTREGAVSPVSVDKFVSELTEGNRLVASGLWSPREVADLKGAIAYARMIQNKATVRAQQPDPEGTLMAVASRSVAFIARAMYRIIGQGKAEELFFTPKGIEALRTIATTNDPSKTAWQTAAGTIAAMAGNSDERQTAEAFE